MCSRREQPHRRIGKIRPTGELGKFAPQANSAQAHPGDSASCSSGARAARTQAYPVFTTGAPRCGIVRVALVGLEQLAHRHTLCSLPMVCVCRPTCIGPRYAFRTSLGDFPGASHLYAPLPCRIRCWISLFAWSMSFKQLCLSR